MAFLQTTATTIPGRAGWIVPAVLCLCWMGCAAHRVETGAELRRFEFQQPHMGTLFTIKLYARDRASALTGAEAAFARIAALDRMMTDYDPESELMQLCRRPVGEPTRVSEELFYILQESQRIAKLTDGAFDVTIGPVIRLWRRARRAEVLPTTQQLARAQGSVGWRKLQLDAKAKTVTLTVPNMQLDLGGIAKGYAADQAMAVLKRHGFDRALVAASGDIVAGDPPPGQPGWRVDIGVPARAGGRTERTLLLTHAAVSTSGDAEQAVEIGGKRYSHIVDPWTGVGLTEQLQVSIVTRRATESDAFATAASVLGRQRGLRLVESQPGMAGLFVRLTGDSYVAEASKRLSGYTLSVPSGRN